MEEQAPETTNLHHHLTEGLDLLKVNAIAFSILCLFWSYFTSDMIETWLSHITIATGPNNENLSIYSPFEWVMMRWEIVLLFSLISLMPLSSILIYRFAKPGLYPRERTYLVSVLFLTTTLVPVMILIIWIYGIPYIFDLATEFNSSIGVGEKYDAASIFSIGIGITWVLLVWAITILILSLSRVFGLVENGNSRFRLRIVAISASLLVLTLPVEYDGLKLVISIIVSALADGISRMVPVAMPQWTEHQHSDTSV